MGYDVYKSDIVESCEQSYFKVEKFNSDFSEPFKKLPFHLCINASGSANVGFSFENPEKDFELNVVNVQKILEAIRDYNPGCKFINLSSAAVYGNPINLPILENFDLHPISPYGLNKMQAEHICLEFYQIYKIKTCSLRIFSAYGVGLRKQLFWDLFQKFKNNNNIELFGSGSETRDFIYIDDIVRAIHCCVLNTNFSGEAINIANSEELSIKTIATLFNKEFDLGKKIIFNKQTKKGDPLNWRADISNLEKLGYRKSVSIEVGIKKYIDWARTLK
jgi:dTDP-glucose 4,6-dehydratase/UDP-glucose 4-epimerase